jgi:hypothetical protein
MEAFGYTLINYIPQQRGPFTPQVLVYGKNFPKMPSPKDFYHR